MSGTSMCLAGDEAPYPSLEFFRNVLWANSPKVIPGCHSPISTSSRPHPLGGSNTSSYLLTPRHVRKCTSEEPAMPDFSDVVYEMYISSILTHVHWLIYKYNKRSLYKMCLSSVLHHSCLAFVIPNALFRDPPSLMIENYSMDWASQVSSISHD